MLHTRSLALLLHKQQKLERGIRSLEQALHWSRLVSIRSTSALENLLYVPIPFAHADVSIEGTATSEESGQERRHVGGAILTRVVPICEEKAHSHVGIDVWLPSRTGFFPA